MNLSSDQRRLVCYGPGDEGNGICAIGATQSGKTFSGLAGFFSYTTALPTSERHLFLGKKLKVLESECLPQIEEMAAGWNMLCHYDRGRHILRFGDQLYYLYGGNDEGSQTAIQGFSVHSIFIDEATLVPESFFDMAMSRQVKEDGRIWVLANPAHRKHWLKVKWIDENKFDEVLKFTFESNASLPERIKERMRKQFHGPFFKRMVEGEWADAEGLIYGQWTSNSLANLVDQGYTLVRRVVGSDYGPASDTTFVVVDKLRHKATGEVVYHCPRSLAIKGGADMVNKSDYELADLYVQFEETLDPRPDCIAADPSALSFRNALRKRQVRVRKAKNEVVPGIRTVGSLLTSGALTINSGGAGSVIDEIDGYVWDPKKPDQPLKEFDHSMDGLRYGVMEIAPRVISNGPVGLPEGL